MSNFRTKLWGFLNKFNTYLGNRINYNPRFTKYLLSSEILKDDFTLLDVGCSGGIDGHWNAFEPLLKSYGFDPIVQEVNRLNKLSANSRHQYFNCFVGAGNEEIDQLKAFGNTVIDRSSAVESNRLLNLNFDQEYFNSKKPLEFTESRTSLDEFCEKQAIHSVDFIKTDTDGHDIKVLHGAKKLLQTESLLGLLVECDFNGPAHPYSNTFRNVDALLVDAGFTLFDFPEINAYTKKELPGKFLFPFPAQTRRGQVCWANVLYLKDLVELKKRGEEVSTQSVLKMACLQEIFGLSDCAAELLITFEKTLRETIDLDYALDLLTKNMGLHKSYKKHIAKFQKNPHSFYP